MYLNLFKNVSKPNFKIVVHLETIIPKTGYEITL